MINDSWFFFVRKNNKTHSITMSFILCQSELWLLQSSGRERWII